MCHSDHVVRVGLLCFLPEVLGPLEDLLAHEEGCVTVLHYHIALDTLVLAPEQDHLRCHLLELEIFYPTLLSLTACRTLSVRL